MSEVHICTQADRIAAVETQTRRVNMALFGNPDDPHDLGAIELIKEIHATQLKMIPTYEDLNNWGIFFKKGRQLGRIVVAILVGAGIIFGSVLAIREWLKK